MCVGVQGNPGIFGTENLNLRSEGISVKFLFLRMNLCSLRNSAGLKNLSPALTKLPSPQPAFPSTAFPWNSGCRRDQLRGVCWAMSLGNSPCSPSRDKMCGKLFCSGGREMPQDGSLVTFGSCKASFPRNGEADPGMILDGTKCGNGMVSRE